MSYLIGYNNVGKLKLLNFPGAPVGIIHIGGVTNNVSDLLTMVVTDWQYEKQANVSFVPTLSRHFYVYAFGHAPGRIAVSGLIGHGAGGAGLALATSYYAANNIVVKSIPTNITVGGFTLNGFLEGVKLSSIPEIEGISRFSFTFTTLMQKWV